MAVFIPPSWIDANFITFRFRLPSSEVALWMCLFSSHSTQSNHSCNRAFHSRRRYPRKTISALIHESWDISHFCHSCPCLHYTLNINFPEGKQLNKRDTFVFAEIKRRQSITPVHLNIFYQWQNCVWHKLSAGRKTNHQRFDDLFFPLCEFIRYCFPLRSLILVNYRNVFARIYFWSSVKSIQQAVKLMTFITQIWQEKSM